MNSKQMLRLWATTIVIAVVVSTVVAIANPAEGHTKAEQADWWANWHLETRQAGGITPELLAEAQSFVERHKESHEVAPEPPRQTVWASAPTGSYTAASGEPWRGLVAAHFPLSAVDTMTCLVGYESAGNPSAVNPSSGASGLLQVMPFWADHFGVARSTLFDPDTNLRIARLVWDEQGYQAWSPWKRGLCR